MKIFKFGGASVKDANGVKNVCNIIQKYGNSNSLIVVSAMGKITNALEEVVDNYYYKSNNLSAKVDEIRAYHQQIMDELFEQNDQIYQDIEILYGELSWFLNRNTSTKYNYVYDQIICFGEILSTKIVSAYLSKIGLENTWFDVRNYIKTDSTYRDAKVNWELTEQIITANVDVTKLNITQGFLGGNETENTTTLGREGSDYTAGIFAYCLKAESVTIWKDVAGVLNADPRFFTDTTLLNQISYEEAIEMAFYGASVIHPKTIQPLQQREIPLYVKSFVNPIEAGTQVSRGSILEPLTPCFIVKKNQVLVSIAAQDFAFIVENNMSYIFQKLHEYQLKVNLIQNSAISFSLCLDNKFGKFEEFYNDLQRDFKLNYYNNVSLYTIRHFDDHAIQTIANKGTILLRQTQKETSQIVLQEN